MKEIGTLKKILVKYEPPTQICPDYNGKPLGFASVFTAFGVLFFGVGITVIIFSLEKFSNVLGLECAIFETYGVLEENSRFSEKKKKKGFLIQDEANSSVKNQISTFSKTEKALSPTLKVITPIEDHNSNSDNA